MSASVGETNVGETMDEENTVALPLFGGRGEQTADSAIGATGGAGSDRGVGEMGKMGEGESIAASSLSGGRESIAVDVAADVATGGAGGGAGQGGGSVDHMAAAPASVSLAHRDAPQANEGSGAGVRGGADRSVRDAALVSFTL